MELSQKVADEEPWAALQLVELYERLYRKICRNREYAG